MRIVSLVPSATEIVCALGLSRQLVGVSHACDWPARVVGKPVITRPAVRTGGASATIVRRVRRALASGSALHVIDEAALRRARPDLILTQSLCPVCAPDRASVESIARSIHRDIAVVSLGPTSLEGVFNSIATVGAMSDTERKAVALLGRLRRRLGRIEAKVDRARAQGHRPIRVVALEWLDPPMTVGHWVPEQIRRAGGWDLLGRDGEPSVRTTWRTIRDLEPEMLLVMPCGLGLADAVRELERLRKPAGWADIPAVQRQSVIAVDGSAYFSRPGPRVVDGIAVLAEIFDPGRFIDVSPPMSWVPVSA